mgnify:CR=1 FL=1
MHSKDELRTVWKVILFIAFLSGAYILTGEISRSVALQDWMAGWGYLALFFLAVISGFNLLVPIPAVVLVPAASAVGLDPWLSALTITLGMTLGDSVSYFLGGFGREILFGRQAALLRKLEKIKEKNNTWPIWLLFLYAAFVPLPNEIIIIPMAVLGYPAKQAIPAVFLGNLFFNFLATAGLVAVFL